MAGKTDARLTALDIKLPEPPATVANYVAHVTVGNLVFVSGQGTRWDGEFQYVGKIGGDLSVEEGYRAARICACNLLAHLREACAGDLDRIRRVVKLGGFINCTPDFKDHPKVLNGASDVFVEIFGERGQHTRFAVGVCSLPFGMAVEVDGVFEIS